MSKDDEPRWENRRHFFGAAAQAMRRILLNRARDKHRLKRGGNHEHVALDDVEIAAPAPEAELLALDQGIHHCLANHLERQVPLLAALHPAPVERARQLVLFRQRPGTHRYRTQREQRDEILPSGDSEAVEGVATVHSLPARSEEASGLSAHSLYGSNFHNAALPSPRGSDTLRSFPPFRVLGQGPPNLGSARSAVHVSRPSET